MAAVFCCGFECGLIGTSGEHWTATNAGTSISTSTVRSGARSARINPAASTVGLLNTVFVAGRTLVGRIYIRFASLPSTDYRLITSTTSGAHSCGILFQNSDSKLYCYNAGTPTIGATGVTIAANIWYRIDFKFLTTANPWTIDAQVDGAALGQVSVAQAALDMITITLGDNFNNRTADVFFDDHIHSITSGDYPLGAGYVHHFVPTADGTHNVAGTNDFEIGTGGTDILNATTTAWQLVDDIPLQSGAIGTTDFINMVAPPNATDYVECIFGPAPGIPIPTAGPRVVEFIAGVASAGGAANNMEIRLNDNGTMGTIYTQTGVTLTTSIVYKRAAFADPPSAASAWTAVAGNGNFNNARVRFGSPAVLDVTPDPYFACIMAEAEFSGVATSVKDMVGMGIIPYRR